MLAELTLTLGQGGETLTYAQSSILQGVMMEQLDPVYAATLHRQGLNAYSQCLLGQDEKHWVIRTTTREAYDNIIQPLLRPEFSAFVLKKKGLEVRITDKKLETLPRASLLDAFYSAACERRMTVVFETPASFKSGGHYICLPTARLLVQSLMNKYSASSASLEMFDEETLDALAADTRVTGYSLHSETFPLEGVRIPAYRGWATLYIGGSETMARYAELLLQFGRYSGAGIKTAMGMGAIRVTKGRRAMSVRTAAAPPHGDEHRRSNREETKFARSADAPPHGDGEHRSKRGGAGSGNSVDAPPHGDGEHRSKRDRTKSAEPADASPQGGPGKRGEVAE